MKKLTILVPVLAVFVTFAMNAEAEPDVVRLGNLKFAHYAAVSYMKEICGKYNLKVEERTFPKGPDIMPAIIAGEIDIAALASDGAISGRANGVPIYAVAGFAKGGARIIAGSDSGIKNMKGFKGKKIGVTRGGMQELLLYAELEKAGLSWSEKPGKDVQIIFLAFADLNQALAGKQIDGMCQSEPQSSQAINKKFGVEILKPYNTPIGEPLRVLTMTEKMYNEKRDIAQRVLNCFVETTMLFKRDDALAEKYVVNQMFKGQLTAQDYQDAMSNAKFTYDISYTDIDATTQMMNRYGVGKMVNPPRAAEWVRNDLLQRAKTTLKAN